MTDPIGTIKYTYAADGRRLTQHQTMAGSGIAFNQSYTYDSIGRLTGINYPGSVSVGYGYANGRLRALTARIGGVTHNVATGIQYQSSGQVTGWTYGNGLTRSHAYDLDGRLTTLRVQDGSSTRQSLAYTYDNAGRITRIGNGMMASLSQDYIYDAQSRLVQSAGGIGFASQTFLWDANGNRTNHVHDGTPISYVTAAGSKALVWRANNYAFTRAVAQNDIGGLHLGFPGQYYDAESGLWYNGFRTYDPFTGRHLESDPIGLGGGPNTYAYVGGNPVSRTDPLGLACNGLGCWNTPTELGYANAGNYGLYYQAACAGGDSYACAARVVATGQGNSVSSMAGTNFTNGNLRNSLRRGGSECPDKDMENIRKDLMNARVAQLSNDPNNPRIVSGQSISDFHNAIFGRYGATDGWGPFPVFGGDIPVIGNMGGWEWCTAPACRP